jgi:hypothetical protein
MHGPTVPGAARPTIWYRSGEPLEDGSAGWLR